MSLEIFNCEQGTPEWFECRRAIPTASMFQTVQAKGKGGGDSVTRRKYMLKLIGESLTGQPEEGYKNSHMERGNEMEAEARQLYSMVRDIEPIQIGFIRQFGAGASPDSLIENHGLLEIKTKLPSIHLEVLLSDKLPSEHVAQVQGQLWVSGREWCDFVSYWPSLPIFIKRIERDEKYIEQLSKNVTEFLQEMENLTKEIMEKAA